ncbi:MAG TPA: hypothetical protein DCG12_10835 [Planctomycetaceae bacterium]|nr:hypothetical protein [Planctomycetaceae bacterium]
MTKSQTTRRGAILGAAGVAAASIGFVRPAMAAVQDQKKLVTLIATLQIADGKADAAKKYFRLLTEAVEKNEPGTLAYVAHTYRDDPGKVIFFEVYNGQDALKKHKPGAYDLGMSAEGLFDGKVKVEFLERITGYIRGEEESLKKQKKDAQADN